MADVELRVTADLDQATKELAGFSKEYAQFAKQVEKPLRQVNATRELEANLEATGKQVRQARQRLQELQRELISTDYPTTQLKESFREATKELQKLERVEATQASQLSRMRTELKGAGVDTTRLTQEQRRLNSELSNAMGAGRQDAAARGIRERAAALKQQASAQRQATIEAARQDLGVNRFRALQAEIQRATAQYDLLRRSGKLTAQELAVAQQQLTQRIRESKDALRGLAEGQGGGAGLAEGLGGRFGAAGPVAGVAGAAALATQYAAALDPIKKMNAQLKLATDSQEEFARAQAATFRIAQENQAPLEDVVTLYSRLTPALRDVGRGQGDALKIIDAVTKSLRISGATAQETASTIQQFSQALGSGVLRGEEFNALAESSPRLLRALAEALKVNVGALRAMAADGQLTADVISDALIGQLSKLTEEAAQLPDTFGGAVTKLTNELQAALGKFDEATGVSGRFIEKINSLTAAINLLASGSLEKASAGAASFSVELAKLVPLLDLAFSSGDRALEFLGLKTAAEVAKEAVAEEVKIYDFREERLAAHAAKVRGIQKKAADDTKATLDQQVKDTKAALAEQVKAERKAASELESAKKAQLDTQQRYQEALAKVNGGVAGEPSYASATALKVSARNALQAGDVEGAKRQAQAALAVIEQLAAAGENTFGFSGFVKELQAIEQAADQQGIDSAQQKLEEAKKAAAATKAALEELKDVKVSATLSPEDEQKLLDQLSALAKKAGVILTIPVTPVMPEPGELDSEGYAYVPNNPPPPQFATGGYTGPGGKYEPAGVVHRGEVVWSQLDIARAGGVAVVEAMRRGIRGYSVGGIVAAPRLMPSIPAISPSLMQQADPMSGLRDWGKATLATPGGDVEVLMREDSFARLLRKESARRGSPRRNN